jgi:prophage regulatory protein
MLMGHLPQNSVALVDRFIGEDECLQLTNLSRTTRWRLERNGKFPKRRQISTNRCAWSLSEVQGWMQAKMDQAA